MSATYSLCCPETRRYVWIGQGWGSMTTLYSGEPRTMDALKSFLNAHLAKELRFVCNDATIHNEDGWEEWVPLTAEAQKDPKLAEHPKKQVDG